MMYTKEFKEEASQLGLPYYTLSSRRTKRKAEIKKPKMSESEMEKRNRELEIQNAELIRANEILKDALGFSQKTGRSKDIRASSFHKRI